MGHDEGAAHRPASGMARTITLFQPSTEVGVNVYPGGMEGGALPKEFPTQS